VNEYGIKMDPEKITAIKVNSTPIDNNPSGKNAL
jgi:hypothetical protein